MTQFLTFNGFGYLDVVVHFDILSVSGPRVSDKPRAGRTRFGVWRSVFGIYTYSSPQFTIVVKYCGSGNQPRRLGSQDAGAKAYN